MASLPTWLRRRSRRGNGLRRQASSCRPHLEALEPRLAPATLRWVGDVASSNRWLAKAGTNTNWSGDALPQADDTLIFPDTAAGNRINVNDTPAGTSYNGLTISGTGYSLTGNGISLAANTGLTVNVAAGGLAGTPHVGFDVTFPSSGNVHVNNISNNGPAPFLMDGVVNLVGVALSAVATAGDISFGGPGKVTGSGGLIVAGSHTVTLLGNNDFAGGISVSSGTLDVESSNALGAAANTVAVSIGATLHFGAVTVAQAVQAAGTGVGGAGALRVSGTDTATLSGLVTLTADATFATDSGAALTFTGPRIGESGGARSLTLTGGNFTFNNSTNGPTYTGTTTLSQGTLTLEGATAISGPVVVGADSGPSATLTSEGAQFNLSAPVTVNHTGTLFPLLDTSIGPLTLSGGLLGIGQTTQNFVLVAGLLTMTGGSVFGPGTLKLGGDVVVNASSGGSTIGLAPVDLGGTRLFTVNGSSPVDLLVEENMSDGGVIKAGTGTMEIDRASYGGPTTVNAGVLLFEAVDTSTAGTVNPGGTLGGNGGFGSLAVVGGRVDPGGFFSPTGGLVVKGDASFDATSSFNANLNGTVPITSHDTLAVGGALNLGGATLNLVFGYTPAVGDAFKIIAVSGSVAVAGTFAGLAEGTAFTANGLTFRITYRGGDGNDVVVSRLSSATSLFVVPLTVPSDANHLHSLASAVAAAPNGAVISIEPGVNPEAGLIAVVQPGLVIQGDLNLPGSILPAYDLILEVSNVTLQNLHLGAVTIAANFSHATILRSTVNNITESLSTTNGGGNAIIQNVITGAVTLSGNNTAGIATSDVVANNSFSSTSSNILVLTQESGTTVQLNTFVGEGLNQIGINASAGQNVLLANNTITLLGTGSLTRGIELQTGLTGVVRNNAVSTNGVGIGLTCFDTSRNRQMSVRVEGNDLRGNAIGVQYLGSTQTSVQVDLGGGPLGSLGGNDFRGYAAPATATAAALFAQSLIASAATLSAKNNVFPSGVNPSSLVLIQSSNGTADVSAALSDSRAFVQTLYNDLLGRSGALAELDAWVNVLNRFGRAAVANGILRSSEALGRIIDSFYLQFLGRQSDSGGRAFFVTQLQRGVSEEDIMAGFIGSPEFLSHNNTDYVQALYLTILHRSAAPAELAFWYGQLPRLGLAGVAAAFSKSPENRTNVTTGLFQTLLHRTPAAAEVSALVKSPLDLLGVEASLLATDDFFAHG